MKSKAIGSKIPDAVAVVGTWDPIGAVHVDLLGELRVFATAANLLPVAIVIHPAPASFLRPLNQWVEYDALEVRLGQIARSGVQPLVLDFRRRDLQSGVGDLFDALIGSINLRELWLGARQSLGSGELGNQFTIIEELQRRDIGLRRLSPPPRADCNPRQALRDGQIWRARQVVGHGPTWKRPRSGTLCLYWPAGKYSIQPLSEPGGRPNGQPLEVMARAVNDHQSVLEWPDEYGQWLEFLTGPADSAVVDVYKGEVHVPAT